jgi:hypothetical protein
MLQTVTLVTLLMKTHEITLLDAQSDMKIKRKNDYNTHIQAVDESEHQNLCSISCVLILYNELNIYYLDDF